MIKTKTKTTLFFTVALCLLLVAGYVGAFYFVKNSVETTSTALNELKQANEKRQNLDSIQKTLASTETERTRIDSFFLTRDDLVRFIPRLQQWGKEINVAVTLDNLNELSDGTLGVDMHATGSFTALLQFVTLVENLPYGIEMDKANLTEQPTPAQGAKTASAWNSSISLKLLTYKGKTQK